MSRTSEDRVRSIIDNDTNIDVSPFIRPAGLLTDKISSNDADSLLTVADLIEIETFLAAHFYAYRDQLLSSKSTGGASGSFQGQTGMYFEYTPYGQMALLMDVTGYLSGLQLQAKDGRKKVAMYWLGSTETEKNGYDNIYLETNL